MPGRRCGCIKRRRIRMIHGGSFAWAFAMSMAGALQWIGPKRRRLIAGRRNWMMEMLPVVWAFCMRPGMVFRRIGNRPRSGIAALRSRDRSEDSAIWPGVMSTEKAWNAVPKQHFCGTEERRNKVIPVRCFRLPVPTTTALALRRISSWPFSGIKKRRMPDQQRPCVI